MTFILTKISPSPQIFPKYTPLQTVLLSDEIKEISTIRRRVLTNQYLFSYCPKPISLTLSDVIGKAPDHLGCSNINKIQFKSHSKWSMKYCMHCMRFVPDFPTGCRLRWVYHLHSRNAALYGCSLSVKFRSPSSPRKEILSFMAKVWFVYVLCLYKAFSTRKWIHLQYVKGIFWMRKDKQRLICKFFFYFLSLLFFYD